MASDLPQGQGVPKASPFTRSRLRAILQALTVAFFVSISSVAGQYLRCLLPSRITWRASSLRYQGKQAE